MCSGKTTRMISWIVSGLDTWELPLPFNQLYAGVTLGCHFRAFAVFACFLVVLCIRLGVISFSVTLNSFYLILFFKSENG